MQLQQYCFCKMAAKTETVLSLWLRQPKGQNRHVLFLNKFSVVNQNVLRLMIA